MGGNTSDQPPGESAAVTEVAPGPWRALGIGFAWLLAAVAAQPAAGFLAGAVVGFHNVVSPGAPTWVLPSAAIRIGAVAVFQLALLWIAWRRRVPLGLGLAPVRRGIVLLALALALLPAVTGWLTVLTPLRPGMVAAVLTPAAFGRAAAAAGPMDLAEVLLFGVLAPWAEELFFRGWLWSRLRLVWGPAATAAGTSALWLLMHVPEGPLRVAGLLPLALALSVARVACGSTWASLALHLLNNLAFLTLQRLLAAAA